MGILLLLIIWIVVPRNDFFQSVIKRFNFLFVFVIIFHFNLHLIDH